MSHDETTSDRIDRKVPRIALYREGGVSGLLEGFPGRFLVTPCDGEADLRSLILAGSIDLLVLDCRDRLPSSAVLESIREDSPVEFLAVGQPTGRKTLPSWLISHHCPWPVERRSFYRLVVALVRRAGLERAFARQGHALRELEERAALGQRVAQVLHELNNPLDAVRRFVALAMESEAGDDEGHLANARLGLDRMKETLDLLRRDTRESGLRLERCDLATLIREVLVLSGLASSTFDLRTRIEDGPHSVPRAVGPVLLNLLLNAKEASGERGKIEVGAVQSTHELRIWVSDHGEGFGDLFRDELFEPYFTTRDEGEGLGLGLFNAKTTMERLGGKIEGHSPGENEGATFTLRLPLRDENERASS